MDGVGALSPFSSLNTQDFLNLFLTKHVVCWRHVVAKRWIYTLLSNVINIESRSERESEDNINGDFTEFLGDEPDTCFNEKLSAFVKTLQNIEFSMTDQFVLFGEGGIRWVLVIGADKSVTDGHTFEVHLKLILVDENKAVGNSRNVVTSIALTGDVEIFSLELWVNFQEFDKELSHVLADLFFISVKMRKRRMGESCSNWLIDVNQVGVSVPRVRIRLKGLAIFFELIWSILIEKSDFGGASWSSGEPKDNWVIFW
jgi:hypothetical protein